MIYKNICKLIQLILGTNKYLVGILKINLITHNQQVNSIDEIILTHKCQEN